MQIKPSLEWLLIFIPVTLALEHVGVPAPYVFFSAAIAIVPIANLIVRATEQIATRTGDAIGGLLNATFGNAPELIIAIIALKAGLLDMVRASLVGAVLVNLLLGLGLAFLLGGLRFRDQDFNPLAARMYGSMMLVAVVSLSVPSAFSRFFSTEDTIREETLLNAGLALALLATYGLYLVFMLKTHPGAFAAAGGHDGPAEAKESARWSLPRALVSLLAASALAAWMSEILVGAAEGTGRALGMSQVFIGIVFLAIIGGATGPPAAIVMARRNKMDLAVGIALGSCIQMALFVAPVLVLVSYVVAPQPLALSFGRAEIGALFMAVLIGTVVAGDGRSNWFKGVQLIAIYAIMALMFYFLPEVTRSG